MNSEQYLSKLRDGKLEARLQFMADEYKGPGGACVNQQAYSAAKRNNLLEAIRLLRGPAGLQGES